MKSSWLISILGSLTVFVAGYLTYESQRTLVTFADTQTIYAQLHAYGATTARRYIGLNNQIVESEGLLISFGSSLDRSKINFSPREKNGIPGFAYTMTVSGLNKRDCENLEQNILFDSVVVNGQQVTPGSISIADVHRLCRSTFWPWATKNVIELVGS